jgi:putative FmdB family regulatory protein
MTEPIYEYQCQECGAIVHEKLFMGGESGTDICCSHCDSQRVSRMLSVASKLDKIIELLEGIMRNTQPVITSPVAPSVWVNDYPQDTATNEWTSPPQTDEGWPVPMIEWKICSCDHCRGRTTSTAGGCASCGCSLVAIFTESGKWWCNKCHQATFYQDGRIKKSC